jgi:hypothetical protein
MIGLNRAMGSQTFSLDDKYNNKVVLNRWMENQLYPLDDEYNNKVGLNRSMGSQPYSLDDEHGWDPTDLFNPTIVLCSSSRE